MNRKRPKRVGLTARSIDALKPPERGRRILHDKVVRGLAVSVQPSGARSFHWFRKAGEKAKWIHLGEWPSLSITDARSAAEELNTRLARWKLNGKHGDPFAERSSPTLAQLIKDYLDTQMVFTKNPARARANREWQRDKYLGTWKEKKIATITSEDIENLHARLTTENGAVLANRIVGYLKTLFHHAKRRKLFAGELPTAGVRMNRESSRDRYLTPDELRRLFDAMDETLEWDRDAVDFIALSLFCGSRKSDTIAMSWDQLDLENGVWRIPTPKNSKAYRVPLPKQAREIIERRREAFAKTSEWIFPASDPAKHKPHFRASWERIVERAKLTDVTLHDCRRTYGTLQASLPGSSLILIARSLGHENTSATQVYARAQLESVRTSVQGAADAITAITTKK